MAKALINFHLHIEPTTSQNNIFPAKTQSSRKPKNHQSSIKLHGSRPTTTTTDRRKTTRSKSSISSFRKLLSIVNSGSLESALQLFETMSKPKTFVWNVIIKGLVDSGLFEEAIGFYIWMQFQGIKADNFTFPFLIKACAGITCLKEGQKIHSMVIKLDLHVDIYICNALIMMYAKVGCIEDAEKIFRRMPVKDLVTWNSMISGYVSYGNGWSSLNYLRNLQKSGLEPDRFSCISGLNACALELTLSSGEEIFCRVLRKGLELDSMIQSSLIDMFGKCSEVDYAERLFNLIARKNIVVWNAMIGAYSLNNKSLETFACLVKMKEDDNLGPDAITLINLIPSVSKLGTLLQGKAVHGHAVRKGYFCHLVLETALVDMYGKCGSINLAEHAFSFIRMKNLVSWNAMIAAYVKNSENERAIKTFQMLLCEPHAPDETTFSSVLAAYAEIALPIEGKQIHCHVIKSGISLSTIVSNALIHLYAECGDLDSGQKVFDDLKFKDIVSWNTVIMGYAIHGLEKYCFRLFSDMIDVGFKPTESTFVSILSACSIAGNVDQGWKYFDLMKREFGLDPEIEHYGCLLDLLGREGNFDRAKSFIEKMPLQPTKRIWGSLLTASRHHKNIQLAQMAAEKIFSLDNDNTGCYLLLSNMYAELGRWEDVERVKNLMKKRGLVKTTGFSTVECHGKAYSFKNYDKSKNESGIIYDVLDILLRKIGETTCSCNGRKFKLPDLVKTRKDFPVSHSVRLAVCFGLIGTSVGDPLVIRKNVRICQDCHRVLKKISRAANREIVVGDSKMYHHFKDDHCSCGDYW